MSEADGLARSVVRTTLVGRELEEAGIPRFRAIVQKFEVAIEERGEYLRKVLALSEKSQEARRAASQRTSKSEIN